MPVAKGLLAQLAEHSAVNRGVAGSRPAQAVCIIKGRLLKAEKGLGAVKVSTGFWNAVKPSVRQHLKINLKLNAKQNFALAA